MARWLLTQPHYIFTTELIEWEKIETDPITQRQNRKRYRVPLYIDLDKTVCQGGGMPGDVEFEGEPTPDMMPLDDEAKEISAGFSEKWSQSDYGIGTDAVLANLGNELSKAMARGTAGPVAVSGVTDEQFNTLQQQVVMLMEQNAQLLAKVLEEPKPMRRA